MSLFVGLLGFVDIKDRKRRGIVFFSILEYIASKQPRTFILENVRGLVQMKGGKYHTQIMRALTDLGIYNIYEQVLDTRKNGLPQSRHRWYAIGTLHLFVFCLSVGLVLYFDVFVLGGGAWGKLFKYARLIFVWTGGDGVAKHVFWCFW